jgi:hypothetical protein
MNNEFPNRRWLVIPTNVTNSIDFTQVLEISPTTLRLSVDKEKTFVKYDVTVVTSSYTASYIDATTGQTEYYIVEAGTYGRPSSIYNPIYPEYEYQPILDLLATPEWTVPLPDPQI